MMTTMSELDDDLPLEGHHQPTRMQIARRERESEVVIKTRPLIDAVN